MRSRNGGKVPSLKGEVSVPRLFYCTVAGLVIATGLSFLFGASGLFNYRELKTYETRVVDGIAALQDRHRRVQQRAAVLRDNPEALRLLARETGYFRAGETVIEVGPAPHPTAVGGARSGFGFADVAPLLQRTPPAPREPFNTLALGLFLGGGSFAALGLLRTFRRRAHAGDAPGTGAAPVHPFPKSAEPFVQPERAPRRQVPAAAGGAEDPDAALPPPERPRSQPVTGAPAAADDRSPPPEPAPGGDAGEPAGRRRKARRRRHDVTVYRL